MFHSNPQHLKVHAWCLGVDSSKSKASLKVAERIAAPQRSSTRTIYKSKWALFEKWCRENSVDFSTPSVKQVSNFFMYLYQDLNRHPSTIGGYRTAIVDTLGPAGHHIAQSSNLHRLLSVSTGIIAKVPGIFLNGTFPVTIPALTTIVDRQFKEDRTLCPERVLRYYLDQTKDLRGSRSLLFISFKKGHTSDIRPATLSSWLKQTILYFVVNKQTNKPWTWSKLKHMTLGPSLPLRPFMVGYRLTKSCKPVTGKLTTHLQIFT